MREKARTEFRQHGKRKDKNIRTKKKPTEKRYV
jgi:hypothetical protein